MKVGILHEYWSPLRMTQSDEGVKGPEHRMTVWESKEMAGRAGDSCDADFWFVTEADVFEEADVDHVGNDSMREGNM